MKTAWVPSPMSRKRTTLFFPGDCEKHYEYKRGPAREETTRVEQVASSVQETGGAVNTWMLLWLAEGYSASGRADLGLDTLAEALEFSANSGER